MNLLFVRLALLTVAVCADGCARSSTEPGRASDRPLQSQSAAPKLTLTSRHRIAAGEGHTCVIRPDTSVWCWGRDSAGQLLDEAKPAAIRELSGASALFAHDGVTCAITRPGLWCWGDNLFGQLRMPATMDFWRTPELRILADGRVAQDGVLGPQAACEQGRTGIECWGDIGSSIVPGVDTRFGTVPLSEQGKNAITGQRTTARRHVPGIDGAVQLAIGVEHVCALMPDRSVRCLGSSQVGQLGRRERDPQAYHPAAAVPGLADVVQIEAGLSTTCARTARGEVHCWGSDYYGQLGQRDHEKLIPVRHYVTIPGEPRDRFWSLPLRVEGLPPVRQLSVGATHVCTIGDDRRVYCWGMNQTGQLGDATTERRDVPVVMIGVAGAVDVAASTYGPESHTCVLLDSGKVQCVGRNGRGELGRSGGAMATTVVDVEGM